MVSETVNMEEDTQIHDSESNIKPPEQFFCSECGRKFTKLGLIYHKKTCTEKEDCKCAVCSISKVVNVESRAPEEEINRNDLSQNTNTDPVKYTPGKIIVLQKKSIMTENDNTPKPNGLSVIEPSLNLEESQNMSIKFSYNERSNENTSNSVQVNAEVSELVVEHGGEPCSRHLFCEGCNDHISWDLFGIHLIQDCSKLENEIFHCPACPKTFSRPTMLLLHYYIHASSHPVDCLKCRCSYKNCIDSSARTAAEHCYANIYRCYICLKGFFHENSIANHMRLHAKETPFKCTMCPRSFTQIGNLQRHMTAHQGLRPHECQSCFRAFADPATLRNHMRIHTRETPYICTMCKRGFTQVGNLKRHLALHLKNEKKSSDSSSIVIPSPAQGNSVPLDSCMYIDKDKIVEQNHGKALEVMNYDDARDENDSRGSASSQSDPSNSTEIATEEIFYSKKTSKGRKRNGKFKIFPCSVCNKIYTWQHDLQVHFRTHTGEKPYHCNICDKRFAQSGAVRTHLARHHSGKVKSRKRNASKSILIEQS